MGRHVHGSHGQAAGSQGFAWGRSAWQDQRVGGGGKKERHPPFSRNRRSEAPGCTRGLGRPCGVAPELKDRAQRASRPSTCCPEPLGPRSYLPTCVPRPFTHPREQQQPRQPCPSVLGGHKVYVIWGPHPCGSTPGRLQAPTCTGARQAYGWRWGPALDLQTTVPSVPGRGAQARTSHRPSHIRSQTTAPPTPPPRWRVRRRGRAEQRRRACRAAAALTVQCLAGPCCREHALFHS